MDPKEKYRLNFLNVSSFLGLLFLFVFTIINWENLSGNGGWGVLGVIAMVIITLFALIVDGILQVKLKNKKEFNLVSVSLALFYLLILLSNFR